MRATPIKAGGYELRGRVTRPQVIPARQPLAVFDSICERHSPAKGQVVEMGASCTVSEGWARASTMTLPPPS